MKPTLFLSVSWVLCHVIGCSGASAGGSPDESLDEDDWTLPSYVTPSTNAGFFNETIFDPRIQLRAIDLSWRQFQPTPAGFSAAGAASGVPSYYADLNFAPLAEQLADSTPFWMRFWVSDVNLAPTWIQDACPSLQPIGKPGYLGDVNYPIFDPCFWDQAKEAYRELLIGQNLRADPRLRFIYVPGAFTYCEFDFDLIEASGVDFATFNAWYQRAMQDLVDITNGENGDPSDDFAYKLVFTGEDYPFSGFGQVDDRLAEDAVRKGMGIRTGITELFNFHLSDVPAYGTTISTSDGHMVTDDGAPAFGPGRVRATENECYNDCGFETDLVYYAVKMSNMKALQLRMNWILPGSELGQYRELWDWVGLELGKTVLDSPDAWCALRDAEDLYWSEDGDTSKDWPNRPVVKNWERWLVQRDVAPDGITRPGSEVRSGVLDRMNGVAVEGRTTDPSRNSHAIYFDVDDRFIHAERVPVEIKVTYRDVGGGAWWIEYAAAGGTRMAAPSTRESSGRWRTATVRVDDGVFDGSLPGGNDFRVLDGGDDALEVRFVRIVKVDAPR